MTRKKVVTKAALENAGENPREKVKPGGVYINPLSDEGFKKLLGSKSSLISFLNATMRLDKEREIQNLSYRSKRISYATADKDSEESKTWCFDVRAKTRDNRHIDVEVQNMSHHFFNDRVLTYGAALLLKAKIELNAEREAEDKKKKASRNPPELTKEEKRERRRQIYELPQAACVWVCNFRVPMASPETIDEWNLYSAGSVKKGDALPVTDRIRYIIIQLPYFNKSAEELESIEDQWLYVLKNAFKSAKEFDIPNDAIHEALDRIRNDQNKENQDMMTREERDCIVASLEYDAEQRGYERGEQQGYERGEQHGYERGREESAATIAAQAAENANLLDKIKILEEALRIANSKS